MAESVTQTPSPRKPPEKVAAGKFPTGLVIGCIILLALIAVLRSCKGCGSRDGTAADTFDYFPKISHVGTPADPALWKGNDPGQTTIVYNGETYSLMYAQTIQFRVNRVYDTMAQTITFPLQRGDIVAFWYAGWNNTLGETHKVLKWVVTDDTAYPEFTWLGEDARQQCEGSVMVYRK